MLPGLSFVMGTASAILEMAFVTSSVSATTSVSIPATAQAGDVCFLINIVRDTSGSANAAVTPSGFSKAVDLTGSASGDGFRFVVHTKVLTSGDVGASVAGVSGTKVALHCLVFRPTKPVATISALYSNQSATTGTPATLGYTPGSSDLPIVYVAAAIGNGNTPLTTSPAGFSGADVSTSSTASFYVSNNSLTAISSSTVDSGNWTFLGAAALKVT